MKKFLDHAADMYYKGSPIISDEEWDILADHFDYYDVGHKITDGIPHLYPMYSLQKVFDLADAPLDINDCFVTPKLDGAAVSLLYVGGELVLALTRGDGKVGRDITDKMRHLVPEKTPWQKTIQVVGEVIAPTSIPNARNYAAGSLNLKDMREFIPRAQEHLVFVAYDFMPNDYLFWGHSMAQLGKYGFYPITDFDTSNYPKDGMVFRWNNQKEYQSMGYTNHHPRGAFALKEQAQGVVTKLQDVVWQVGRSGVVSPVAILEPVMIGDAKVSRATLHNLAYIEELGLELGCNVEVIRSGEIIPRIVRRV